MRCSSDSLAVRQRAAWDVAACGARAPHRRLPGLSFPGPRAIEPPQTIGAPMRVAGFSSAQASIFLAKITEVSILAHL